MIKIKSILELQWNVNSIFLKYLYLNFLIIFNFADLNNEIIQNVEFRFIDAA